MRYVIGDVHGCFDELMLIIKKITRQDKDAAFILTGDLIDRGPKVGETIEWAMENITPNGRFRCIRGNHEQLAIDWYYRDFLPWTSRKFAIGKKRFPESEFDFSDEMKGQGRKRREDVYPIIEFFESLPFSLTEKVGDITYRIVHSWYLPDEKNEEKQHFANLWSRYEGGNSESDEIIIHGHNPTLNLERTCAADNTNPPGMINYYENAINVDGGCVFGEGLYFPYACMLCAVCLETLEEFYPYTLEERFMNLGRGRRRRQDAVSDARAYAEQYDVSLNPYRQKMLDRLAGR